MDRGRAARRGQKPTAPTTSDKRIQTYRCLPHHSARPALHEKEGRGVGGHPHLDTGAGTRAGLKVPLDGQQAHLPSEEGA
jgi:hypothetical protein